MTELLAWTGLFPDGDEDCGAAPEGVSEGALEETPGEARDGVLDGLCGGTDAPELAETGTLVLGAIHCVHIVDTEVLVTVETV